MNEPEGLSTPLWCGQVHCPYGHAPRALWSGFGGSGGWLHNKVVKCCQFFPVFFPPDSGDMHVTRHFSPLERINR